MKSNKELSEIVSGVRAKSKMNGIAGSDLSSSFYDDKNPTSSS